MYLDKYVISNTIILAKANDVLIVIAKIQELHAIFVVFPYSFQIFLRHSSPPSSSILGRNIVLTIWAKRNAFEVTFTLSSSY